MRTDAARGAAATGEAATDEAATDAATDEAATDDAATDAIDAATVLPSERVEPRIAEPISPRDPNAIAAEPLPASSRLQPCRVVLRHTVYDEETRAPTTRRRTVRRLVRSWTDDLREREWRDVAPIPLTLEQARALLPRPAEHSGARGVEVLAEVGDGQLHYRFDARGRAVAVAWDPTADSSTYEYEYEYGCRASALARPYYEDDRDPSD